ncbi:conserved hypothetical protein [uncultured Alphaproteobacteria bacterium]|uniref:DUF1543 domain-containing protein n=1 Tax=uncultured Alphaproteobacteria bacterium TaxID=91750 RepID=A0A212KB76_9PROT|nr:conserved hypothetical protein [uncultured Alphaproteobacteria bacterium]
MTRLFAVLLGGRASKSNTELHDVVFVAADRVEAAYDQLLEKWFGLPDRVHVDSWMEISAADGHRVVLGGAPVPGKRLWYVNLGTYADDRFAEIHANGLFVAATADAAKMRAKAELLAGWPGDVHTDDVLDVEATLARPGLTLGLEPAEGLAPPRFHNGYLPLPKDAVAAFKARR